MIVYFDTSAVVPLMISEPTSDFCRRLWDESDAVATSRLTYAETAAALGQAQRLGRMRAAERDGALRLLDRLWAEFEVIDIDEPLVRRAADLAVTHGLRGYDAVHCASAEQIEDGDLVAASGDRRMLESWHALGVSTADTNGQL